MDVRRFSYTIWFLTTLLVVLTQLAVSQPPARVAQIPGIAAGPCNPGPEDKPWLNPKQTPECRALEVIAQMTLEEKQAELGGITGQSRNARLGLVAAGGSDGPNGVGTMSGRDPQPRGKNVTAFANAVTLAATWDRDLARRYGQALGEEFVGKGSNSVLGPTINIMRTWHWGRNGETLSEDPYLTTELAVAEIAAIQQQKVLTVLKHYAGNNQENTRVGVLPDNAGIDARITDKALHEIYLPAFKAAVERAHTGGIMCSYNQVNGKFSCNNPELLGYLRQWGFDGFIAPADVAIVFAAEQLGEGQDKVSLPLPGDQDSLIEAVAQANPRTIVVLHTANPVSMPWLDQVAAVVEAFYPGQEAGSSIARVLFGDVNPSGKLAMTFPANEHQGPGSTFLEYPGDGMTVNFNEGVQVGYRYYDANNQEPLFPFGHGLSYTTFRYSGLEISHPSGGEQASVRVKVTNTGGREGAEVAQLYLGFPAAAQEPPKVLRGFEKLRLKPGESKVATRALDRDSLAAWDADTNQWRVYPGIYSVMVGASSREIALKGTFTIASR